MEIQSSWFANEMINRFKAYDNIFFSDEAYFHLNGYVSQQNCRYWSSENPNEKHETQLYSLKVTVRCAIHAQGIIGPYFLEDERGRAVTVDSDRYVDMLNNFFEPALQDFGGYNWDTWFQQDGITCHTSNRPLPVIQALFPEKLFSRPGDLIWPPRSPDLAPCDFHL